MSRSGASADPIAGNFIVDSTANSIWTEQKTTKRHIIRMAFLNAVKSAAQERRRLHKSNASFASLCIIDAFQGRLSNGLANNSKKSGFIYRIFCIQTSRILLTSVLYASVVHTISVFVFNNAGDTCVDSTLYTVLQWCIMILYMFDVGLKMYYEGLHVSE
jgi:hypothetical protein